MVEQPDLWHLVRNPEDRFSRRDAHLVQLETLSLFRTKIQIYRQKLLPRHPPVFSEWFLRTFPDPTSWYNARLAYCRTIAVMSMVGYILGLGDRHGENILFDSTSGDCVHVDFNCLFNRVSYILASFLHV